MTYVTGVSVVSRRVAVGESALAPQFRGEAVDATAELTPGGFSLRDHTTRHYIEFLLESVEALLTPLHAAQCLQLERNCQQHKQNQGSKGAFDEVGERRPNAGRSHHGCRAGDQNLA